eukprot:3428989-Pyramimonas_sp.AAC.1
MGGRMLLAEHAGGARGGKVPPPAGAQRIQAGTGLCVPEPFANPSHVLGGDSQAACIEIAPPD